MSTQLSSTAPSPRMRFVRLNPRFDRDESLELLKSEIKAAGHYEKSFPLPVPWLNSKEHGVESFAIPGEFGLNRSSSFRSGRVYGMDVTSGAAVAALLFDLYDADRSASEIETGGTQHKSEAPLRVLDLCCAPGLKLCMMADLAPPSSILTGVDISSQRISLCKTIVAKYHIDASTSGSKSKPEESTQSTADAKDDPNNDDKNNKMISHATIRLYCADGTTFGTKQSTLSTQRGLVFDSHAAREEHRSRGKRKRMNKSARAREKRRLLELQRKEDRVDISGGDADKDTDTTSNGKALVAAKSGSTETRSNNGERGEGGNGACTVSCFDRVLVDAECSTDGAMRHIEKRQSSLSSSRNPVWDDTNMNDLVDLQKRLIESGFRLLKTGGTMVYSTCSLSPRQNEQVVRWLLDKCNGAFMIPVCFAKHKEPPQNLAFIEEGSVPGAIRFNPTNIDSKSNAQEGCILPGSGFFLAKIGKR